MHCKISGVTDHYAHNELHALEIVRNIVKNLNHKSYLTENLQGILSQSEDPLYEADELNGLIPTDSKKQFDVREVIARVVDGSR